MRRIYRFLKSDDGPTAVEYAILASAILAACVAAIAAFYSTTDAIFSQAADRFNNNSVAAGGEGSVGNGGNSGDNSNVAGGAGSTDDTSASSSSGKSKRKK